MEKKYNIIRTLQKDISIIFELIDKNKQNINIEKLGILNQLLDIFKKKEIKLIDNLFDGSLDVSEDEIIKRLNSLKTILNIILELEKNIKESMTKFKYRLVEQ